MEGFEAFHWFGDFLDEAVILFDDVVQIFHLKDLDQRPIAEEKQEKIDVQQAGLIGAALVDHNLLRHTVIADSLLEEGLGRLFIALFGQYEIQNLSMLIDRGVLIHPPSFDRIDPFYI